MPTVHIPTDPSYRPQIVDDVHPPRDREYERTNPHYHIHSNGTGKALYNILLAVAGTALLALLGIGGAVLTKVSDLAERMAKVETMVQIALKVRNE